MLVALAKVALICVTIIMPGGLLLAAIYLLRTRRRGPVLDFDAGRRRVPMTRTPPPSARALRRAVRRQRA